MWYSSHLHLRAAIASPSIHFITFPLWSPSQPPTLRRSVLLRSCAPITSSVFPFASLSASVAFRPGTHIHALDPLCLCQFPTLFLVVSNFCMSVTSISAHPSPLIFDSFLSFLIFHARIFHFPSVPSQFISACIAASSSLFFTCPFLLPNLCSPYHFQAFHLFSLPFSFFLRLSLSFTPLLSLHQFPGNLVNILSHSFLLLAQPSVPG